MQTYYEKRQPEYEAIYAKPERQADLQWMRDQLSAMVAGKRVLELEQTGSVPRFDAASIDCVVAGFLYSHVLHAQQVPFLSGLQSTFAPNAALILFDNQYVEGSSTPIHHTTSTGDTYQRRSLRDGSEHDVLKNFPTKEGLQQTLQPFCNNVIVQTSTYFWLATGNLRG